MNTESRICVAGSKGMLGHAIIGQLEKAGYRNVISCDLPEVDLCDQKMTEQFFEREKPEYLFFLAAVAGGIQFKKTYPADMLLKNLQMITNVMSSAQKNGCCKMINVCSALLYPVKAQIPLKEEDASYADLGLVDTPYAIAKAVGMQLARNYNQQYGTKYITVVPCNFFGEFAPFEGDKAGVVSALIARIHHAKVNHLPQVAVWGTGNACREFLNSQDVASACIFIMKCETEYDLINIGRGSEFSIREVAEMIKNVVGYEGELFFDSTKPEGRAHMQLNTEKISALGWHPSMNLEESIRNAYEWYVCTLDNNR